MKSLNLLLLLCTWAGATEFMVITTSDLPPLTQTQLRLIYLKKLTTLNNIHLIPLNLPATSSTRQSFEKHFLKMSRNRLKAYWTKQHYLGHRPPLKQNSPESIKSFVNNVSGTIGYIKATTLDSSYTILYRWSD